METDLEKLQSKTGNTANDFAGYFQLALGLTQAYIAHSLVQTYRSGPASRLPSVQNRADMITELAKRSDFDTISEIVSRSSNARAFSDVARAIGGIAMSTAVLEGGVDLLTYNGPSRMNRAYGILAENIVASAATFGVTMGAAALSALTRNPGPLASSLLAASSVGAGAAAGWAVGEIKFGQDKIRDVITKALDRNLFGPVNYQSFTWEADPNTWLEDRQPYRTMDPQFGVRYSGYTGPNTGYDTPSEVRGPAALSAPPSPLTGETTVSPLEGISSPVPSTPSPLPNVTPINLSPGITPIGLSPTFSQPYPLQLFTSPPQPNVDSLTATDGRAQMGGVDFGGGYGGGNGDYYGADYGGGNSESVVSNNNSSGRGSSGSSGRGGGVSGYSGATAPHANPNDWMDNTFGRPSSNSSGALINQVDWHDYLDPQKEGPPDRGDGSHSYEPVDFIGPPAPRSNAISDNNNYNDYGTYNGPGYWSPILMDLSGNGFSISELTSSNTFVDLEGNGYQRRIAWAGSGAGILVLDADGDGKISRSNEFVFTEWDVSAVSDLGALKNVFDTNGNGKLDSGDARWSEFKVAVNGQLVSLDSLGIVSIDLTPTGSGQTFSDGSAITGTTTFTRADGTTGAVGDAVLATDSQSYIIRRTDITNANGSKTETILGFDKNGGLAFRNIVTTTVDGYSVATQFDDDGNGTIDRSQSNVTSVDSNGVRTKTVDNYNADGSLRNRTTTITSADLFTITTEIDQNGDGFADERQIFVKHADGSSTTTTQSLSASGAVLSTVQTEAASSGLAKTSTIDVNGDGTSDLIVSEDTVIVAGSRTKTVAEKAANGTTLSETITSTSADNRTKTITQDADGNGSIDTRSVTVTTIAVSGAITAETSVFNGDNSLRGKTTSNTSADGLSKTVAADISGDGIVDRTFSDVTIIATDGSQAQTVQTTSANGTLLAKTVTTISADRKTIVESADLNGDGANDLVSTITVASDGATTTTVRALNTDGTLIRQSKSVTSADGLSKTVRSDIDGNGTDDRITSTAIVSLADGSREETVITTSASGAVLGKTVTTTSADSLTQTVKSDLDGNGTFDQTISDVITLAAGGARSEVVSVRSSDGTLTGKVTTVVSADRRTTTVTSDADGDGHTDSVKVQTVATDGHIDTSSTVYAADGAIIVTSSGSLSADGLTLTSQADVNGDGVADNVVTDQTLLGADGGRTRTISVAAGNGGLVNKKTVVTSGNGLTVEAREDVNGDGVDDLKSIAVTTLNSNGSVTKTVSDSRGTSLTGRTTTTASASGLSSESEYDADGNGTVDGTTAYTRTLNADGSTLTVEEARAGNGSLTSKATTVVSADGKTLNKATDVDGNGSSDVVRTLTVNPAGVTNDQIVTFLAGTTVQSRSVVTSSANGLSVTSSADLDGDGVFDRVEKDVTVLNSDGSQSRTITKFGAGNVQSSKIVTVVSADGLTTTTVWSDKNNATVRSMSSVTVRNADGGVSETLYYFKSNGSLESRKITSVSAHGLTSTVTVDVDGDGIIDQRSVSTRKADASVEQVLTDLASNGSAKDVKTVTVSADGLRSDVQYDVDGNGTIDKKTTSVTVLNGNGSKTTTIDELARGAGGLSLKSRTQVDVSADGLSAVTHWDADGSGSFEKSQTDTTILNPDGSRSRTITTFNGTSLASRYLITTSANGLSVTEKWDLTGSGSYSQIATNVTVLNANGTTTRTLTSSKADGTLISRTTSTVDTTGRIVSTNEERPGFTNQSHVDTRVVLADGSIRDTRQRYTSTGQLSEKSVEFTSADQRTFNVDRDVDGDGIVDQREQILRSDSGEVTAVTTDYSANGTVRDTSTRAVSADGRQTTITWDFDGDGSNDRRRVVDDVRNADGSRITISSDTDLKTGLLSSKTTSSVAADGQLITTTKDLDGDGIVDQTETTTFDPTGASSSVVVNNTTARDVKYLSQGAVYWKQAVAAKTEAAVSMDRRVTTVKYDYDNDGIFETTMQRALQIDGSSLTTISETAAGGAVKATGTISTSSDGRITKLQKDSNNDGIFDHTELAVTNIDGSITLTKSDYNTSGAVTQTVVDRVNALGSLFRRTTSDGLGRKTAQTDYSPDGTSVASTYDAASGQILTVSHANKAGLLTSVTLYDPLNTQAWSRVEQSFDSQGRRTLEKQFNDDGTRVEISLYVPTGAQQQVKYFNAAGVLTGKVDFDVTNSNFWSKVTYSYNAAGQTTSQINNYDDGTRQDFIYDVANAQSWSRVEQSFDAQGKLWFERQYKDDGTRVDINFNVPTGAQQQINYFNSAGQLTSRVDFDATNSQPWSKVTYSYNASGQTTSQINNYDDGTRQEYVYDVANVQAWSRYENFFDAAGRYYKYVQYNDNGTFDIQNYDVDNSQVWSKLVDAFDQAWNIRSRITFNDDGTRHEWVLDLANNQSWWKYENFFDNWGRHRWYIQYNDDGTQTNVNYDFDNSQGWSRYEQNLTSNGSVINQTNFWDDGNRNVYHYDVYNNQSWSYVDQSFTNSGSLSQQFTRWDDNSTENILYDVYNTQIWDRFSESKTSWGSLISQVETYWNNQHRKFWDPYGSQSWDTIEDYIDNSGNLIAQYIIWDGGGRTEYRPGGGTAQQIASFDANYYLAMNPDLAAGWHAPPIEHFMQYGWKEGRRPNQWFDPQFYLNMNPDIKNAGINPFVHWRDHGYAEGRYPYANYYRLDYRVGSDTAGYYDQPYADLQLARIAEVRTFAANAISNMPDGEFNTYTDQRLQMARYGDNRTVLGMYPEYIGNRLGVWWAAPVILDLNGDGNLDLTSFAASGINSADAPKFDWDGDGIADDTAWVGSGDGWLAIDLAADGTAGADGVIDQARELAFTLWKTPGEMAAEQQPTTDLEALRMVFDTNGNNQLDSGDARWAEFRVWQDTNQNGITDAGELRTLEEADIRLISLVPTTAGARELADTSAITGTSSYTKSDGSSAVVGDARVFHHSSRFDSFAA